MARIFMLIICVNMLLYFLLTFMMCTEYADVCHVGNFMYAHCTCCTVFELIIFLNKALLKEYFPFLAYCILFQNIIILVYYID